MKVLFFDIDGVLNDHNYNAVAKSNTFLPRCVEQFNRIIHATKCKLVISSAWRYMVSGSAVSLSGFEYMMRTHGCSAEMEIIGRTALDEEIGSRKDQILAWVADNDVSRWVAVDDLSLDLGGNFVQTNEKVGLTAENADEVIRILNHDSV